MNDVTASGYYEHVRYDAIALLPTHCERVLEVGCGTGATLAELKRRGQCRWAGGVEVAGEPGRFAAERLDRFWNGNIETFTPDVAEGSLDALLCLDVLEHLVEPWQTLRSLAKLLKPGAVTVISVPNVRNHRVVTELLLHGRWDYESSGIMDRTHLRFFTRDSAASLVSGAGFRVDRIIPLIHLKRWKLKWMLQKLARGRLDEFYAEQFLIRGIKE
jgi:2-polyprenyl-3-methyl-5-hydroxy-6-metoxy-1,4-benzoquinol methylase